MHVLQQIQDKRFQKKIDALEEHLKHTQSEVGRLNTVLREKQDRIDVLLNSGEQIDELRQMIKDFNRRLEAEDTKKEKPERKMSMEQNEQINKIQALIKSEGVQEHTHAKFSSGSQEAKEQAHNKMAGGIKNLIKRGSLKNLTVAKQKTEVLNLEGFGGLVAGSTITCPSCQAEIPVT